MCARARVCVQVWTKFEKIGTEMVALAKSLTEKSTVSCLDKVEDELICTDLLPPSVGILFGSV